MDGVSKDGLAGRGGKGRGVVWARLGRRGMVEEKCGGRE